MEEDGKGGPVRDFFLHRLGCFPLVGNEREALCNGEDAISEGERP